MFVLKSLLIGLVTALVAWYLKYTWSRRRLYSMAAKIPGPNGLPFVGVALSMLGKNHQETFKNVTEITKGYESPSRVWAGPICVVIVDKPEDLQIVFNSQNCIDKAAPYKIVPMETGLLVSGGDLWRAHRKLINPSFHMKVLQSFQPVFNEKAKMMVKVMKKYLNQEHFDVYHHMSACTLEALLATSIGLNKDIQNEENNKYLSDMEIAGDILTNKFIKVWLHYKPFYKLTKYYKLEQKHIMQGVFKVADDILEEKQRQKLEDNLNEVDEESFFRKPQIFIDQIMKFGDIFNEQDIKDEINTLIVAGHETSALTMSGILLMLALHQDVQEKVIQELEHVFDSVEQETNNEMLNKLPYIEMVIKETLRLFPIAPIIGREATKNIQLKKCTVPAGATIILDMFHVQRNPKYWGDDAHLFNPDRFLPENFSKIHPYAYAPFSKGPRNCIGMKYGMNVMKVILTDILRNYKVTTNLRFEDIEYKVAITLRIVQGYMIKLEKRQFNEIQKKVNIMFVLQTLLIGLLTAFAAWYSKFWWNRRHLYRMAAKIPGPKGLPLFGVALTILGKSSQDSFKHLISLASEFPSPSKFWAGYMCIVAIDQPDDIQVVLNSQDAIDKPIAYKIMMKHGLIVDGGDLWRSHRKLLNPSFNATILQRFLPTFNEKSKILVKVLAKHLNGSEFDVFHPLSGCTLEALLSTSLGLEKDIQNDPNNWILHCMEIGPQVVTDRAFKIWLHFKPLYMFSNLYKMEKKYVKNGMFSLAKTVLKEKELEFKINSINKDIKEDSDDESGIKKPQIFIDQLLKMREHLTLKQIRSEINTILLAGHETSALTISGTLLMLALHQDVQEKVIQELGAVFDSVDQETDNEMLNKFPYIEMVIKETLRLFPVAAIIARNASKDIELQSCTIPAGATIILNMFDVQRNPKYWGDDAHLFNPDRFLPQNFSKIHSYAYIPFSKGPRNCIGMKYGMNVMKVVLSHILRNFKLTTNLIYEDLEPKFAITLRIKQNYMVKFEKLLLFISIGLITAVVVWYGKFRWNRRNLYRLAAKIPGPKGLPLFGHVFKFLGKNPQDIYKQLNLFASEFPSPSKFWAGFVCAVAIDKPDDIQVVLNSQDAIDKPIAYKIMMKHGLIVDGGDLWRSHRKLLNPSFNATILQSFLPIFNEKSKMLVKVLAKHLNQGEFDVYDAIAACTLESLLSTSLGLEKDIQNDPNNWFLHCVEISGQIFLTKAIKIWLQFKPLYIFTKHYQMEKKYVQNGLFAFGDEVLKEKDLEYRTKLSNKELLVEDIDDESGIKKPQIFIDQLFKIREHFTLQQIRDEINLFLFAGHETSALTISATLLMLALHQDVQEKVMQELEDVFDSVDQKTDNEILNKLPYLEMVIKETLRLVPVAAIIARNASKDIELQSCTIPAGATIILNMFDVQRNPKYWGDDAHLFNPDRFLPENFSKIHPYAYFPFSKGPRNCIGMKYGMNVMEVTLSHILRNYKVATNIRYEDLEFKMGITIRFVQGYKIKLEKREFKTI
ncbi:unnamed protein product [Diamesa serratosioi]